MTDRKESKQKRASRFIALAIAGVMVLSVLAAAILSQVW